MSSYTQSSALEPPPSYAVCTSDDEAQGDDDLSAKEPRQPTDRGLVQDEDEDLASASASPPPPFPLTPGMFVLGPQSVVIHSPAAGARALYQLSRPLNGHASATCLIDVPAGRKLKADGTLKVVRSRDELYDVHFMRMPYGVQSLEVIITSHHRDQFGEVRQRKCAKVGLTGLKFNFEATGPAEDKKHTRLLYHTKQKEKKGGVLEWWDGAGVLVAVETRAADRRVDAERLEILVPLDKRHLDLMVALWVARIYQDSQLQGAAEDRRAARQRKADQKQLDKEEGRPSGVLHDMKEALGIGYGLKARPRTGGLFVQFPGVQENGRINWGERHRPSQ